jgi:hypothetical protein
LFYKLVYICCIIHLTAFLVMENPDKPLSSADSLQLIHQMILAAKQDLSDNSFDFLWWGWVVALASVASYALQYTGAGQAWWPWATLMPLAAVGSVVYHVRQGQRQAGSVSPLGQYMRYLWTGMAVMFAFAISFMVVFGNQPAYILFMALYGLGTFATGGAIRFRALLWGGVGAWVLAGAAFWVKGPELLLLLALALLVSYIIPGHLLKAQYRRGRAL